MEYNKIRFSIGEKYRDVIDYEFNNYKDALNYFLEDGDYFNEDEEEVHYQIKTAIDKTLEELDTEESYSFYEFVEFFDEIDERGKGYALMTFLINYVSEFSWKYSSWDFKKVIL